jgi:hypothetical protein
MNLYRLFITFSVGYTSGTLLDQAFKKESAYQNYAKGKGEV